MKIEDRLVLLAILQGLGLTPDQIQGITFLIQTYYKQNKLRKIITEDIKKSDKPDNINTFEVPKEEINFAPKQLDVCVQEL